MGSLGVATLFHSNPDTLVRLGRLLESAGFDVVSALIPEVRSGRCDVDAMIDRHDPSVVVYDVGPPYEESWNILERLRASHSRCAIAVSSSRW